MTSESIPLSKIRLDGGTQPRAALHDDTIEEYAAAMRAGDRFPDIVLFFDGSDYWIADGAHRWHAATRAGRSAINAEVRQGTRRDAQLHSFGANADHGLRRSNADKRRAILAMLTDPDWSRWSDRQIAKIARVDHKTVARVRAEYAASLGNSPVRTYVTKHGTISQMTTDRLGEYGAALDAATERRRARLDRALDRAPAEVIAVAAEYAIDDPEVIDTLGRLYRDGAESFSEVAASGYIQPGDESEAVHITEPAPRVLDALRRKSDVHRLIAGASRQDDRPAYRITAARLVTAARVVLGQIDHGPQALRIADWKGTVCALPTGAGAAPLLSHLIDQYHAGIATAAIAAVDLYTIGAPAFAPFWDYPLCFAPSADLTDRPRPSGVMVAYLGDQVDHFAAVFGEFGFVVQRLIGQHRS